MTAFTFRLATLLQLREATRDVRRGELAASRRAAQTLQQQRDRLRAEWHRAMSVARQAASPGAVALDRWADTQHYQQALEARLHRLGGQLAELAAEIEHRRETLLEADREVRTLEKLREAQRLRHQQESQRQEIKGLDEATQLRAVVGGKS